MQFWIQDADGTPYGRLGACRRLRQNDLPKTRRKGEILAPRCAEIAAER